MLFLGSAGFGVSGEGGGSGAFHSPSRGPPPGFSPDVWLLRLGASAPVMQGLQEKCVFGSGHGRCLVLWSRICGFFQEKSCIFFYL